ncbi:hypothetical protein Plo01_70460 [Planobispora longispora]|uniref:Uncharacterized protein n=1 Tax=Planobispora longispora TaxID=28887 RepID=A0A8J3RRS1_9ACTN|nr:hypothetical protein Plo01_70460 [Planobispora longispora]
MIFNGRTAGAAAGADARDSAGGGTVSIAAIMARTVRTNRVGSPRARKDDLRTWCGCRLGPERADP